MWLITITVDLRIILALAALAWLGIGLWGMLDGIANGWMLSEMRYWQHAGKTYTLWRWLRPSRRWTGKVRYLWLPFLVAEYVIVRWQLKRMTPTSPNANKG